MPIPLKIGEKIGMLTVLELVTMTMPSGKRQGVKVDCECGNIRTMQRYEVSIGRYRSCGCAIKKRHADFCNQWKKAAKAGKTSNK